MRAAAQSQIFGRCRAANGERIDVIDLDEIPSPTAPAILRDERALTAIA
jgi:hypothetical protein